MTLLRQGIDVIPADKSLFSLYQSAAEILSEAGRTDEAVTLLRQGIDVIPADKSLYSLYKPAAEILSGAGRTDEAVTLLRQGIDVIPADKNLFSLYQGSGDSLLSYAGRDAEAIQSQLEGFGRIGIGSKFNGYKLAEGALLLCAAVGDLKTLTEVCLPAPKAFTSDRSNWRWVAFCNGRCKVTGKARRSAPEVARQEFSRYILLFVHEALSHLGNDDPSAAWDTLSSFQGLVFSTGLPLGWLTAFIHLRRGNRSDAAAALRTYLDRPVDNDREVNESFLLRLWDEQEAVADVSRLCFHFPLMPPSLTGLSESISRLQFSPPVLPSQAMTATSSAATVATATSPEIYVSYAWGEDSTEAGRQREEIVDRLCAAVGDAGYAIGRDKERMRAGDSIERFAREMSKAERIIAVISEKSLHSDYCMAHELFRAFRRCDYQRGEFQEKVIAVVMDDAKAAS